jgi:SAM-dependent methyltransferase
LELGCSHGGLVALLRLAGFEASGLELSPWVVDFARRTFDIPMYSGSIENQQIEPGSLDMIALFDVLEHISDPVITLTNCLKLLKPQGTLLIQTPKYPENMTYDQMLARDDIFLDQLKANEHLYLYSIRSIREIFHRIGIDYLKFETAFFDQYDMFFIASRLPHSCYDSIEIEKSLKCYSNGMIILALLDLFENINKLKKEYSQIEFDRADRYKQIVKLTDLLKESETDRSARYEQIVELTNLLKESETDRSARYEQIVKLTNLLKESETDRSARYEQNIKLTNLLKNYEIDLADKVKQITLLEGSLKNNDMNRYIQKQHLISMKSLLKKIERYPEIKWRRKLSKLIRK